MNWKKVIRLTILILIPVLVTFFIGWYGYDYYAGKTQIKIDYYEDVEANTQDQLAAFMKYNEFKYEKDAYFKTDVKAANGDKLLTFEIYRAVYEAEGKNGIETKARYIFVLYDVNSDKIIEELASGETKYYNKPTLSLVCMPTDLDEYTEEDAVSPIALSTTAARTIDGVYGIVDYVASEVAGKDVEKIDPYSSSTYTGAYYARWNIETNFDAKFEDEFVLQLKATATNKEDSNTDSNAEKVLFSSSSEEANKEYIKFDLDCESWNVAGMEEGFNNDEVKAGYFGWVLGHYLWWICLIALVLSFLLTYTFVAVWEYDDTSAPKKSRK